MPIADTLRTKADKLQPKIDHCFRDRLTNTRKRAEEDAHQRREGHTLKAVQDVMRRAADLHEAKACPKELADWKDTSKFEIAVRTVRSAERQKEEYGDRHGDCLARLTDEQKIVRGLMRPVDTAAEKLHALERDVVRSGIPGFFPTPRRVVEQMLDLAGDLRPDMRILEPSAGRGNIADVIRERCPEAALTLIEYNYTLKQILGLKGHEVQSEGDFMKWAPADGAYFDLVVMNPPFEQLQDIDHVRRAYQFLKPGGRIVAITSPSPWFRQQKKAEEFRNDFGRCRTIELPSGTFENTGVSARIVVIDKPKAFERYPGEAKEKPGKCYDNGWHPANAEAPPIVAQADPEYQSRIDAARVTAEFKTKSTRRVDAGREPITDAPIFGGPAQYSLF